MSEEQEPRNDMVIVRPMFQAADLDPASRQKKWWTTIKGSSMEEKALLLKCLGDADRDGDSIGDNVFGIKHVLTKEAHAADPETGEVNYWIRTVMAAADGTTVSSGSTGVIDSIADLIEAFGIPPWEPELRVRIKRIRTGAKRAFYRLEIVPSETSAKPKGK